MKSTIQSQNNGPQGRNDVPQGYAAMDVDDALRRLGEDTQLLRDIIQIYLEDSPSMVERIHSAVATADALGLQHAAHQLKGIAATLSAPDVVGVASRLEHMGASRDLSDAAKALVEVDRRVSSLNQAVQEFLRRK